MVKKKKSDIRLDVSKLEKEVGLLIEEKKELKKDVVKEVKKEEVEINPEEIKSFFRKADHSLPKKNVKLKIGSDLKIEESVEEKKVVEKESSRAREEFLEREIGREIPRQENNAGRENVVEELPVQRNYSGVNNNYSNPRNEMNQPPSMNYEMPSAPVLPRNRGDGFSRTRIEQPARSSGWENQDSMIHPQLIDPDRESFSGESIRKYRQRR